MLQIVSVLGALAILAAYAANQFGLMGPSNLAYSALNFAGSAVLAVIAVVGLVGVVIRRLVLVGAAGRLGADESYAGLQAFEILEMVSEDRELQEGASHKGPSALLDVVARRPSSA